jgi:sulfatase maturation enzyme AslB (radical SAM superfamily)
MIEATRIHPALPIFRMDEGGSVLFYTPGEVLQATGTLASEVEQSLTHGGEDAGSASARMARTLEDRARRALTSWRVLADRPFEPECLTLYLSNRCNLGCGYCYAAPRDQALAQLRLRMQPVAETQRALPLLAVDAIEAAARVVAAACRAKSRPLTLVLHGGGEPTLHWDLLERTVATVGQVAADERTGMWSYIATHGVLPESRARWLASHFNLIGVSCDGPPEIHDRNRPLAAGGSTSAIVKRTVRAIADAGTACTIRVTITPSSVQRQRAIVEYVCDVLGARNVRFEPVYHGGRGDRPQFAPADADAFVDGFLDACAAARERGCDLQVSGVRLDEIHGPYCNPLRDVLQLTPDGVATACFLCTGSGDADESTMALGRFDQATRTFRIDYQKAAALRRRAARIPARCEQCINVLHCARDCPDVCVITADPAQEEHGGFRCRVQKRLGHEWLRRRAGAAPQ